MLKKHLLTIIPAAEVARILKVHRSQITRMGKEVPEAHKQLLISECRKQARKVNRALEQICKKGEK